MGGARKNIVTDIRIIKLWPGNGRIAPEDAPQRTVCWEENLEENHEFIEEYSSGQESTLRCDMQEQQPHFEFTPYIKALCEELTQGITDPLEKAWIFHDFITQNMKYTFMPSYAVLENMAQECAQNFTGDCGILRCCFYMCRCVGIPTQWQRGLTAEPDFIGWHDWVCFYVEPYGRLFADPSYGTIAARAGKEERIQFYFGNLMVATSQFQAPFTLTKEHWRADP